jgi:hypothetical protein
LAVISLQNRPPSHWKLGIFDEVTVLPPLPAESVAWMIVDKIRKPQQTIFSSRQFEIGSCPLKIGITEASRPGGLVSVQRSEGI